MHICVCVGNGGVLGVRGKLDLGGFNVSFYGRGCGLDILFMDKSTHGCNDAGFILQVQLTECSRRS